MITIKSPIKDFINILDGACQEALDWLATQNGTLEDSLNQYLGDDKLPESWSIYVLWQLQDKLDVESLSMFAKKIKSPVINYLVAKKYKECDTKGSAEKSKKNIMIGEMEAIYKNKLRNIQ